MHLYTQKIYVHHTDYTGFVYHTYYLTFAEYARFDLLESLGLPLKTLGQTHHGFFAIHNIHILYKQAAHLGDLVTVHTQFTGLTPVKLLLKQTIKKNTAVLAEITLSLVWVNQNTKKLGRMPGLVSNKIMATKDLLKKD